MLRAAVVMSLAVAAMAVPAHHGTLVENVPDQVIRFGSVGTTFANVVGVLTPVNPVAAKGILSYEFTSIVDGVPAVESDKHYFRCNVMRHFYVPHGNNPKPVLLCRNDGFEKSSSSADKIAFLFSAENLDIPSGVNDIELNIGKNLWKSFVSAHATAFAIPPTGAPASVAGSLRMETMPDMFIITHVNPFDSILIHDIPTMREMRQYANVAEILSNWNPNENHPSSFPVAFKPSESGFPGGAEFLSS